VTLLTPPIAKERIADFSSGETPSSSRLEPWSATMGLVPVARCRRMVYAKP
jgi:hypothetical protein